MAQKFYQKASVQTAIVTSIGLIVVTLITVGYQRSELRNDNKKLQENLGDLQNELADVKTDRDKYQMQLTPFLAAAKQSFPDTTLDKSLVLLLEKIEKTITEAFIYDLPPEQLEGSAALFAAVKFFLDDIEEPPYDFRWHYHRLVVSATKGLSTSAIPLLRSKSFKDFLTSVGVKVEVMSFAERKEKTHPWPYTGLVLAASNKGPESDLHYVLYPNLDMQIGEEMLRELEKVHFEFKSLYTKVVSEAVKAANSN